MRRIRHHIVLVFFCFSSTSCLFAQASDAEKKIGALMDNYRFAEAIELADNSLVGSDTANSNLLLLKSKALTGLYQYKQSNEVLLKAYMNDTVNIQLVAELSNLCQKKGDSKNAILYCAKACRLSPQNVYFLLQLAGLYFADADYINCIDQLMPLCNHIPANLYALRLTADCYYEMKINDSAEYYYQKILAASPFDTYATQKLANIYIRTTDYVKGLLLTENYLKQDTLLNPVMKLNAWFYHLQKNYKTAVSCFHQCLLAGDRSLFVYRKLGLSYYKQEVFDSAELFFGQAFRMDTTDAETCFYYGVAATRSFLSDTGIVYLNKTLELVMPPEQFLTNIYVELAEAYNNKDREEEALKILQQIHDIYPENKRLVFRLGYQYDYYFHNLEQALEYYEFFVKDAPEIIPVKETGTETTYEIYALRRIEEIKIKQQQK